MTQEHFRFESISTNKSQNRATFKLDGKSLYSLQNIMTTYDEKNKNRVLYSTARFFQIAL